jgi:hypothetical protein
MDSPAAVRAQQMPMAQRQAPGAGAFTPLPRVESPWTADKQQKLQDLLRRYQADELTPEQYHQERGKILAAP